MASAASTTNSRNKKGIEHRRERQRAEARQAILDAAEALLAETGGPDFSMRSLGQRCGYSAPTVYHYFGCKDGVIEALLDTRLAELVERLEREPRAADPLAELRDLFVGLIEFNGRNPGFLALMQTLSTKGEGRPAPPALDRLRERFTGRIQVLSEAGRLGELDADAAGQMLWALMHGLIWLPVLEPDVAWAPKLPERSFTTLLRGMSRPVAPVESPVR